MESNEKIISKGTWFEARMMTIVNTQKIFKEKLEESPEATVGMDLYCRDVEMLLNMVNKAGEELHKLRNKRIIT